MSAQLRDAAEEITRIEQELTTGLDEVDWTGPDADRFRGQWSGEMVPALQSLWSKYDEVVGHCRRYTIESLTAVAQRCGMRVRAWSYWGLTLVPLLAARRLWVSRLQSEEVYAAGFQSNNGPLNRLLLTLSRCEPIPQHVTGSSLMVVLERQAKV